MTIQPKLNMETMVKRNLTMVDQRSHIGKHRATFITLELFARQFKALGIDSFL